MIKFNANWLEKENEIEYQEVLNSKQYILNELYNKATEFSDSLGWFDTEKWADDLNLTKIEAIANRIKSDAEVFIIIGVGGSNNAARSVIKALQTVGPTILYSGNTLSAHSIQQVLNMIEGKSIYINCIAKNFETLEPGSSFRIFRQYLVKKYGEKEAAKRIITTGTVGSCLEKISHENGYTFTEFPQDVGGRFTALTTVGLLPMAVAGIDIRQLICGAREMQLLLQKETNQSNIAYRYAVYRYLLALKGYAVEVLASFEPQFSWFNKWWQQLYGESEGKNGKGILPIYAEYSEDLHSLGQFVQDGSPILFETFLDVEIPDASYLFQEDKIDDGFDYLNGRDIYEINKIAFEATLAAHSKKFPCGTIIVERIDAKHFGELFYFFEFSCYVSSLLFEVNPFNQPGVEAYKQLMFSKLIE
ncbi:glucose-6-phosphate isomerase [Tuanshanicoccus lijuaniae]|uniref:glucose-6-phosphate isomerase n=1 Tax=Aerococcaceae bacterium zg-1292 TaxID=2774330 RepID=UPI001935A31A|nr:glucose-6-phosphate isomerase [Aerococcaceae bacterium zg-1292]MBF6978199.1 glucose-6-phosphate isomerase [Aerococcaceae bacterium zg-BR22]MBS4456417.1 glucose-6-phosphate isomerase [Aerococcaceae bacterium zg-A91]MBS4458267.1 glucose-6-phosphate isomerase [Aerococcaceae bacterium zg-BR33]QQA37500.1 glucose-6-phosphate isomerase [Aerococcaceae bacterium zg-1292]